MSGSTMDPMSMVLGAATTYEEGRQRRADRRADTANTKREIEGSLELERLRQKGDKAAYARSHQGYGATGAIPAASPAPTPSATPTGPAIPNQVTAELPTSPGLLANTSSPIPSAIDTPSPVNPSSVAQDYFKSFKTMYSGGV